MEFSHRFLFTLCGFLLVQNASGMKLNCGTDEVIKVVEPLEIEYTKEEDGEHCVWVFKSDGPLRMQFLELDLGGDEDECTDYIVATGYKMCTVIYDSVSSENDFVLEFVSKEYRSRSKNFSATIENVCRRYEERCDFQPEGTLNEETILLYTVKPDEKDFYVMESHDIFSSADLTLVGDVALEIVTFNNSLGNTICHNNHVITPQSSVPSCHADSPENCAWEIVSNVFVHSNHNDLRGKVFYLTGKSAEMKTKIEKLQFEKVCLYVEYYKKSEKPHNISLMVERKITNDIELISNDVLDSTNSWTVFKILAEVPSQFRSEDVDLVLRFEDESILEIFVNKIHGCNADSPFTDRTVLVDKVGSTHMYSLGGPVLRETRDCANGGKWDGEKCRCLAGFKGPDCSEACGPNSFGPNCEAKCSEGRSECAGRIFCKHGLGCHCAPGYTGIYCTDKCEGDSYGPDCDLSCGACIGSCDIYTGQCQGGCKKGYITSKCDLMQPRLKRQPGVRPYFTNAILEIDIKDDTTIGKNRVRYFRVIFKNVTSKVWEEKEPVKIVNMDRISYNLTGLDPGLDYEAKILMSESDKDFFNDESIPEVKFSTNCIEYKLLNYKAKATHNTIHLTWDVDTQNSSVHQCPVKDVLVEIMIRLEWEDYLTKDNFLNITNLKPKTEYKIRLRPAFTDEDDAIELKVWTLPYVSGRVNYLDAKRVSSTNVELTWEAVKRTSFHTFNITYKCVRLLAQKDMPCDNDSGNKTSARTKYWMRDLLPHRRYLFRVQEDPGTDYSQVYATTLPDVPEASPMLKRLIVESRRASVEWSPPEDCSKCNGYLLGYQYRLVTLSGRRLLSSSTDQERIDLEDLEPSSTYTFEIFLRNSIGWNQEVPLKVEIKTKAEEKLHSVQRLTVYKQTKSKISLRWSGNFRNNSGVFVVKLNGEEVYRGKGVPCKAWPSQYCHTISSLKGKPPYSVTVGMIIEGVEPKSEEESSILARTDEEAPGSPWDLKTVNVSDSSAIIQWRPPTRFNGVLRYFIISLIQIHGMDCCTDFPDIKLDVRDEEMEFFEFELEGLKPRSVYGVKVKGVTVAEGPPALVTLTTRPSPPSPPPLPKMTREVVWKEPQEIPEGSKAEGPYALIVLCEFTYENNVRNVDLKEVLRRALGSGFYIAAEYEEGETVVLGSGGEPQEGTWGKLINPPLLKDKNYTVAVASIVAFNNYHSVSLRLTEPFPP